jgi:hypothetical protein
MAQRFRMFEDFQVTIVEDLHGHADENVHIRACSVEGRRGTSYRFLARVQRGACAATGAVPPVFGYGRCRAVFEENGGRPCYPLHNWHRLSLSALTKINMQILAVSALKRLSLYAYFC